MADDRFNAPDANNRTIGMATRRARGVAEPKRSRSRESGRQGVRDPGNRVVAFPIARRDAAGRQKRSPRLSRHGSESQLDRPRGHRRTGRTTRMRYREPRDGELSEKRALHMQVARSSRPRRTAACSPLRERGSGAAGGRLAGCVAERRRRRITVRCCLSLAVTTA